MRHKSTNSVDADISFNLNCIIMSNLVWKDAAPETVVCVWDAFDFIFKKDMKEDITSVLDSLENVGFQLENEMCFVSWKKRDINVFDVLEQRVEQWLNRTDVPVLEEMKDMPTSSFDIKQITICISKTHYHESARNFFSFDQLTIADETVSITPRMYLVIDTSGYVRILKTKSCTKQLCALQVAECWKLQRMLMIFEIETSMKRDIVLQDKASKPSTNKTARSKNTSVQHRPEKFINSTELLPILQLAYVNMHKPQKRYSALGVHDKECCIGTELQNQLGDASAGISAVSNKIELLLEWEKMASEELLLVSLNNLRYCESDILQKHDICSQPGSAKVIHKDAFHQIEHNVQQLKSCFRWFRGNGSQPKWRVEFFNHDKKRTVSGKAAPPWDVIAKAYMNNFNHERQEPTNTPISR